MEGACVHPNHWIHFPRMPMTTPRSSTATLIKALQELSRTIQSDDGVANAAIAEAAQRLGEMHDALEFMVDVGCEHYDMDCGPNGAIAIKQAREALGEVPDSD
jgi:hypothetical protein